MYTIMKNGGANDSKQSPYNHVKMNRNLVSAKIYNQKVGDQTPTNDDSREIYTLDRTGAKNAQSQLSNNYVSKSLNNQQTKAFYEKKTNTSFHNSSFHKQSRDHTVQYSPNVGSNKERTFNNTLISS